jgi:hypothetical protein
MRRTIVFFCLLALAGFSTACSSDNANNGNGNATRNGVIDTNANISPKANGNSVQSNTAVLTGDNGNANTAGITSTNTGNKNSNSGNHNSNTHK